MVRFVRIAIAVAALLAIGASPVAAIGGKPVHYIVPDFSFGAPAGVTCSFANELSFTSTSFRETDFPAQANGDVVQMLTGAGTATFTNLDTGKFVTFPVDGLERVTYGADGIFDFEISGSFFSAYYATDVNGPGVFWTVGHLHDTTDTGFNVLTHTTTGRVIDLCAAVA